MIKYPIFFLMTCVSCCDTLQSSAKRYVPFPTAFRKNPSQETEYKSIAEQVHKSVKQINPALNQDLLSAVVEDNVDAVRKLLAGSEIPDINWVGGAYDVPTFFKAESPEMLQLLIDAGANVNKNFRNLTPLQNLMTRYAFKKSDQQNRINMAKILLDAGANINEQNIAGHTPLSRAVIVYDPLLVSFFLQSGADVNIKDKNGKTALDHALANYSEYDGKRKENAYKIIQTLKSFIKLQTKEHAQLSHSAITKSLEKVSGARDVSRIVQGYTKPVPTMRISEELAKKGQEEMREERQRGACAIM